MTAWSTDELRRIGGADELRVSSRRKDGSLRPFVTIWVVRVGDDIYIRSAMGPENPWYRRAKASGTGRITAGGVERDVTFTAAAADAHPGIDAEYHTKYDRYGDRFVSPVVGERAALATFRVLPED